MGGDVPFSECFIGRDKEVIVINLGGDKKHNIYDYFK